MATTETHRRASVAGLVLILGLAACGGDDGESSATAAPGADSSAYAAALEDSLAEDSDGTGIDRSSLRCVSDGVVEIIGVEAIDNAGLDPDGFGGIDDLTSAGIHVSAAQEQALRSAFRECLDDDVIAGLLETSLATTGLDLDPELVECIVGELGPRLKESFAAALIGTDAREESFDLTVEAQAAGAACRDEVGVERTPDQDITIAAGESAFVEAIVGEILLPANSGSPTMSAEEATCVAEAFIGVLGADVLAENNIDAAAFADFVNGAAGPIDLGLDVDGPLAAQLADTMVACVDVVSLYSDYALLGLGALDLDGEQQAALKDCFREGFAGIDLAPVLALQFQLGPAATAAPGYQDFFDQSSHVGEVCAARVLGEG